MYRKINVSGRNLNATNQITHIVLNTGKMCKIPPGEFTSEAMLMFRRLVKSGGGPIPLLEGIDVAIQRDPDCALFVFRDCNGLPLLGIVAGLAEPGAADIWNYLKRLYLETSVCEESRQVFGDFAYPEMPPSLPWLASQIYRPGYLLEINCPEYLQVLACIGQGIAAAMIQPDIGYDWN